MRPQVTLRKALSDLHLLGNALPGETWKSWRTLLIAAMGEQLTDDERTIFKQLTGRDREPKQRVDRFAGVIGRRGGKSRSMATLATHLGGLCDHSGALVPGERGVLLCIALDQRVAKIVLDYCQAAFERSPIMNQLIANRTQDTLELTNGISIEVRPVSFRKLRGPTYIAVIADELAFWYTESSYAARFLRRLLCRRRRAAPIANGVSPWAARNTAGSGRGLWYLARSRPGSPMRTSNRSVCPPCSKRVSVTSRTAVYGPVRTVVWEGRGRQALPYPDQSSKSHVFRDPALVRRAG